MSVNLAPEHEKNPLTPQAAPQPSGLWEELITENPLIGQAKRDQLRFFRNPQLGAVGPILVIIIIAMFYLWLVVGSVLSKSDGTVVYSYIELTIMTLVLVASVYGAISGEREKATWDALILTRLTPAQIIVGKLVWRLRLLLFVAALSVIPIICSRAAAIRFEAAWGDAVVGQFQILAWGAFIACFGLFISSITKRSITSLAAITLSLITALALAPGVYSLLASAAGGGVWDSNDRPDILFNAVFSFNPAMVYYVLTQHSQTFGMGPSDPPAGAITTGWPQIIAYLALAGSCVFMTFRRLRRLEEPDRGRDNKK